MEGKNKIIHSPEVSMAPQVDVLINKQILIERALVCVTTRITKAIAERGQGTIALSGGNTPKPLYEALARQALPWEKIHVFWGDERYVSVDHPDSNQRMARLAWLDQVDIPEANIHPMPTAAADPEQDAQTYENELATFFQVEAGHFPAFDLILLGLGDDGHTASLFPHTPALTVGDRLITVGNKDGQPRLTFTIPLINRARSVVFLVAGASKQHALGEIFAPEADPQQYPARFIQPQGELIWLLDQQAGENLRP
ncbi:glucose-6-P-dehydrogenase [Synechocystis sp. PCC 6803]|nr:MULTISPECIES: 6-phosphogluconolactonase [unclassified Synechocystis]AGF53276.1 glucose-6-P-dehydrogenase [Synechocystis sp. PCC 6803]ALJ69143.1 6-phosphogluconolactonase [Synechocystis sp. PCC 6803]AVP91013.1 6-phosphogluconolactonase [Synechocystis sp. IPPAS B-1465]MBD2618137.1 6-phosphogluconolactonase [Synechocystis sp. FACHB-898]MBD2637575.1 6-phosphogluconolactonase [Synechocystis sp. FACHB-908]